MRLKISRRCCLVVAGLLLMISGAVSACFCQDNGSPQFPQVELLKLGGSKPNLSPSGEGITSIKTSDLFKVGVTQVKPFDSDPKIELPPGYKLYRDLAYVVDSAAVFSGPHDFTFRIPSATTSESFDKLRVLFADYDQAEPNKPRWVDVTLLNPFSEYWERYLPKSEFDKRLPDFTNRTLHAFMEETAKVLVVAIKDEAVARDNFEADIALEATASAPSVMEGREITYSFKITNNGPDKATGIWFKSYVTLDKVSLEHKQGVCRWEAHNIYCNLGELAKGASTTITFQAKCGWGFYIDDKMSSSDPDATPQIGAAEPDSNYENNIAQIITAVDKDPNKAPTAEIISPKSGELIRGPDATVPIVVKAADPDGFVTDVELFDWEEPIGRASLKSDGEYEFTYRKVGLGRHWLQVKVTDNLGRESLIRWDEFFVNGTSDVRITKPVAGSKVSRLDGTTPVTIQVSATPKPRTVTAYLTEGRALGGGSSDEHALLSAGGDYTATLDLARCHRKCVAQAIVIDESGAETRSPPINFTISEPPQVTLYQYDGEYIHRISEAEPFDSRVSLNLVAGAEYQESWMDAKLARMEVFLNGKLLDLWVRDQDDAASNSQIVFELDSLAPGTYSVYAVATDSDGSVGKSAVAQIVIKPRQ